jgi:transcriptional regulator with XRE-family HTH domain
MEEDKDEIRRILELLRTLSRMLGLTNREIERRMGLTPSYLSRLYGGFIEVKLEHVLGISRAIGLKAAEFFEFAYPRRPEPPSESAVALRRILRDLQPESPAATPNAPEASPRQEQIQQMIQDSLQESLRQFFATLGKTGAGGK